MIRIRKTDGEYELTVNYTTKCAVLKGDDGEILPPGTDDVAKSIAIGFDMLAKNAPDFDEVKIDNQGRMTCTNLKPGEE